MGWLRVMGTLGINVSPGWLNTFSSRESGVCRAVCIMWVYMCVFMGVCLIKSVFCYISAGNIPSLSFDEVAGN